MTHFTLTVQDQIHMCELRLNLDTSVRIVCPGAGINQDFMAGDIPLLLADLPNLIIAEQTYCEEESVEESIDADSLETVL